MRGTLRCMKFVVAVLFAGFLIASPGPASKSTVARRSAKPAPSYDVGAVNNPQTQDVINEDSSGSAVVRAQILLSRAHFSPGEIDGRWGDNLRVAITGYQTSRKLNASGIIDQDTWKSLNADAAPLMVPYVITPHDVAGPFVRIPHSIVAEARLKILTYPSPQARLGEKFHINPMLLARLNPGKSLTKYGVQIMVPNVTCGYFVLADKVVVSKNNRTVSAFAADGTLLAQYPATMGSEHDPLPIGDWKITEIDHYPWFHYNPKLFWDAKPKDSQAKIAPGPKNPVGVVWIGLSKEHYGIHGTPDPSTIGHTESHGCIRLTNWDAEELSKMVQVGTPTTLQE
jgi:lipoprotein-anchoring transpeptidase ErfK/SrfK